MRQFRSRSNDRWPLFLTTGVLGAATLTFSFGPRLAALNLDTFSLSAVNAPLITVKGPSAALAAQSNRALADYARAHDLLLAGQDAEALRVLESARRRPLVITGLSGDGPAPTDVAAPSVMMRINRAICQRATACGEAGNVQEAAQWLHRARALSEQIMATEMPTLDAVATAWVIDVKIGRTERQVLRRAGRTREAAQVAQREKAMRAFYESQIQSEIVGVSEERRRAEFAVSQRHENTPAQNLQELARLRREMEASDNHLALTLMARYETRRTRTMAADRALRGDRDA